MIDAETNGRYIPDKADIFVFRTNIESIAAFKELRQELEKPGGVFECTIDLEDCDKVLRIVCENLSEENIIELVESHGFICEKLACGS